MIPKILLKCLLTESSFYKTIRTSLVPFLLLRISLTKKISELKFSKAKRLFIDVFITHADSIITHFSYWHG